MKHIMIIENMNCEHCVETIRRGLEEAGIACEINLTNKTVAVDRNGDIVANSKRIIVELGYKIL